MPDQHFPLRRVQVGLSLSLDLVLCSLLARSLLVEAMWDKEYINLAILAGLAPLVRSDQLKYASARN